MSPHFGLMDAGKMTRKEAALLRGRLHWRGGRRRLRQGKTALGIATLYDALLAGLRWYLLSNPRALRSASEETDLENDAYVFTQAEEDGLFTSSADALRIRTVTAAALDDKVHPTDPEWFVAELARVLTKIKLLPFPESSLPPEDPATD